MDNKELEREAQTHACGQRKGQAARSCKHGSEIAGAVKCGEFLDQLRTQWV